MTLKVGDLVRVNQRGDKLYSITKSGSVGVITSEAASWAGGDWHVTFAYTLSGDRGPFTISSSALDAITSDDIPEALRVEIVKMLLAEGARHD